MTVQLLLVLGNNTPTFKPIWALGANAVVSPFSSPKK